MKVVLLSPTHHRIAAKILSAGALLFLGTALPGMAQFTSIQNFDGTGNLSYTNSTIGNTGYPGTIRSGNASSISGSNALPNQGANYPNNYTSSSSGFVVYNPNGTGIARPISQLTFSPVSFSRSEGSTISFRLAAYSDGASSGLDATGRVILSLATNINSNFTDYITVQGTSSRGSYWDFGANGVVSSNYPAVNNAVTPSGNLGSSAYGGNGTGASTVRLTLPTGITTATLRITLEANAKSALVIDDVIITSASPLPVSLTKFAAARQGNNVSVNWATATELNNAYFEIQRSSNSKVFKTIGRVDGKGTTNTAATYTFTDNNPLNSTAYYRLHQVDTDGKDTYSAVAAVAGLNQLETAVYPNPSAGTITLPATDETVQYRIYSATGQTVAAGTAAGGATVNIQNVPPGMYFLELTTGGKHSTQRFVRQ